MNTLIPLHCPACGVIATPRIEPGTGPHVAKAVCRSCDRFVKWLPKVFIEASQPMPGQGVRSMFSTGYGYGLWLGILAALLLLVWYGRRQ